MKPLNLVVQSKFSRKAMLACSSLFLLFAGCCPPPPSPQLSIFPAALDFGATQNEMTFSITNQGSGTLKWNTSSDKSWIIVSPNEGSTTTGVEQVRVTVDRDNLSEGTHGGEVQVGSNGGTKRIRVTVEKVSAQPKLTLSTTSLNFGTSARSLTFSITNTGSGILAWNGGIDRHWITIDKNNGNTSTSMVDVVTVTVERSGLPSGTHTGKVQINSNGGQDEVSVIMSILPPPSPQLSIFPTSLDFGKSNSSFQLKISNYGGGTLTWSIINNPNWIGVNPNNGNTTSESETVVTVTVDRNLVDYGKYDHLLQITSNGGDGVLAISMEKEFPIEASWVKLWDDKGFSDRVLTVNYPTDIPNFHNVDSDDGKEGFNDKASAVQWHIAVGWKAVLYDDNNYRDSKYELIGTGKFQQVPDLGSFSDKTSSIRWEKNQ